MATIYKYCHFAMLITQANTIFQGLPPLSELLRVFFAITTQNDEMNESLENAICYFYHS